MQLMSLQRMMKAQVAFSHLSQSLLVHLPVRVPEPAAGRLPLCIWWGSTCPARGWKDVRTALGSLAILVATPVMAGLCIAVYIDKGAPFKPAGPLGSYALHIRGPKSL